MILMKRVSTIGSILPRHTNNPMVLVGAVLQVVAAVWEAVVIRLSVGNDRKLEKAVREAPPSIATAVVDRATPLMNRRRS